MDAKTLNDLGQPSYRERRYYEAGREQGMREAAEIVNGSRADGADLRHVRDRILSAIGEGK